MDNLYVEDVLSKGVQRIFKISKVKEYEDCPCPGLGSYGFQGLVLGRRDVSKMFYIDLTGKLMAEDCEK